MQLASIKALVSKIYPTMRPSTKEYRAAVVLLSAATVGTDVSALADYTGYSTTFINSIAKNLKNNRIFVGNKVHSDWFAKGGASAFYADVNLALGNVRITNRTIPARFNSLRA